LCYSPPVLFFVTNKMSWNLFPNCHSAGKSPQYMRSQYTFSHVQWYKPYSKPRVGHRIWRSQVHSSDITFIFYDI
jgi:hypothetical protein